MDDAPPPIATDAETDVSEGSAPPARLARFHLDPVGGIAGDMFAAAVLDARPDHADGLRATLAGLNLPPSVEIAIDPHRDAALAGMRFQVTAPDDDTHGHVRLADVRARLEAARINAGVRRRALAIFTLLAEAEGAVHGMDPAEVTFHEVGAWDATVDIVAAAYLIEALGRARWSVGSVPLGSGRVRCAHGLLPVPAPAVVHLLRGLATHDDGIEGERVTPTGAAILKHLAPDAAPAREPETLVRTGTGFGSRVLPGLSNVLRVLEFAPVAPTAVQEQVALLRCEIDDQTPEDLALGLDRLRARPGILDVLQWPVYGKKGRMVAAVQVLAEADSLDAALAAVFDETTTLGVRWSKVARSALTRETASHADALGRVRVKRARRPAGTVTAKAELDDLAGSAGHAAREERRRAAEAAAPRRGGDD
ncbi:MAG: LarC family nickel insertion protein [Rhodospirillaceae bacterium]|nr:LarC family nickel insertion protein [Rhodospirillaceae bacterium]